MRAALAAHLSIMVLLVVTRLPGQVPATATADSQQPTAVTGNVVNALTGAPISHARVRFWGDRRVYSGLSGVDGVFSFAAMVPGSYRASVEKEGYFVAPSTHNSSGDVIVELKSGQHLADFSFHLVPPSVISGHVIDENNEPVENVAVEAVRNGSLAAGMTNDQGEFRIGNLRPGRYLIRARTNQNGLPPEIRTDGTKEANYGPTYYPGSLDRDSALVVKAASGQETPGIDIRLARIPIVRVSGRVLGVPKDAQGVTAELRVGHSQQGVQLSSGFRFNLWRLAPGTYWLFAQCQQVSGKLLQGPEVRIDVADRNIDDIELPLVPPFDLQGKVVGHKLQNNQKEFEPKLQLVVGDSGIAEVAPNGTFKISAFRPGLYRVKLNGLNQKEYIKQVRIGFTDYPGAIVDLRNGAPRAPLEIMVSEGTGQIEGTVHDENGRPAQAAVALVIDDKYGSEEPLVAIAGPDGKYSFPDVPPGSYKIFAVEMSEYSGVMSSREDLALFEPEMRNIELGETETKHQDLALLPEDD